MFAGDVVTDKGVGVLLEAHASLPDAPPLVLAGRLADPALAAPRSGVIHLGPLSRGALLAAWQRCAVAVAPSLTPETFGLVALEAMTAGRPVIAARSGGLPGVIGDAGVLVPPGDVPALRAALAGLLADPGRRAALGAAAKQRARGFTASRVIPRVEAAYEQARAHARARDGRHEAVAA
jgi:glycosyltransferase involved in cell wall biosynthesis